MNFKVPEAINNLPNEQKEFFVRIFSKYPTWIKYLKVNQQKEVRYYSVDVPSPADPDRELSFWADEAGELIYSFDGWHEHLLDANTVEEGFKMMFVNIEKIMGDEYLVGVGYSEEKLTVMLLVLPETLQKVEDIFKEYPIMDKICLISWTGAKDKTLLRSSV